MTKLLKFGRPSCVPCSRLSNILNDDDIPYEEYNVEEDLQITTQYGVGGVPTLILVEDDGTIIDQIVGLDLEGIERLVSKL